MTVTRRYTLKLQPNREQLAALEAQRRLHCALYNALFEMRLTAYRRSLKTRHWYRWSETRPKGKTLTYYEQSAELTKLRREFPEYAALSSDSMAVTAQRLDRAYKRFFEEIKNKEAYREKYKDALPRKDGMPHGFPRFRGWRMFPGFGFRRHGSGWRYHPVRRHRFSRFETREEDGRLYIKNVPGLIRVRGRLPARVKGYTCCDLLWREGRWWLSLVVEIEPRHHLGPDHGRVTFDLISEFARVEKTHADGGLAAGPEVFHWTEGRIVPASEGSTGSSPAETPQTRGDQGTWPPSADADLPAETPQMRGDQGIATGRGDIQRRMARCQRGSQRYRRLKLMRARREGRAARIRKERLHIWTTQQAERFRHLQIIVPELRKATKSGKGNERDPGAEVAFKAALNRGALMQCAGLAAQMLAYKVQEAGGWAEIEKSPGPIDLANAVVAVAKTVRKAARRRRHA